MAGRGVDVDAVLADIDAARAELDLGWQPVAEAFARLVHRDAAPPSGP
jgi:hypothetical protein